MAPAPAPQPATQLVPHPAPAKPVLTKPAATRRDGALVPKLNETMSNPVVVQHTIAPPDKRDEPLGALREVPPVKMGEGAVPAAPAPSAQAARALGLIDLFNEGMANDPKFQAAKADFDANAEAKAQAQAGYRPTVSLDIQRNQQNQTIESSNIAAYQSLRGQTQRYPVTSQSLTITQPIYKPANLVQLDQAAISVEQSRLLLLVAEQDLILRSATAYLNLMAAQDGLELARTERDATEKQAQQAKVRFESGLGTVTQLHDTAGRLAVNQAREVEAASRLEDARAGLREITGYEVSAVQPFAGDIEPSAPQPAEPGAWVSAALSQNLALQARKLARDIAVKEVDRQRAGYQPTLNFSASYSREDSGGSLFRDVTGNNMGKSDIRNLQFGLRLNVPLYEGGMTTSLVREAGAKMRKSEQDHEQELRKTERQASAALRGVQTSVQSMAALRKSLVAQQSALEAKEESLRTGVASIVQVVDAQRGYFTAKRDYLQARYDYLLNRLKLKQAVGSLSRTDLEELAALLK